MRVVNIIPHISSYKLVCKPPIISRWLDVSTTSTHVKYGSYLHFANGSSTFMDSCMRTSTCRRAWATSSVTTLLTRIHIRDGGSPREIYFLPFQKLPFAKLIFNTRRSKSQVDCWLLSRNQKNTKGTSTRVRLIEFNFHLAFKARVFPVDFPAMMTCKWVPWLRKT